MARAALVPQIPGSAGAVDSARAVREFGAEHGYPLVVKASYGGGGRGMRTVSAPEEADETLAAARREAEAAFGKSDVYVERYLVAARHVEVQVFADRTGRTLWLGDRDCSVQRRHQKLVEESPAPHLTRELRTAMGEAAVRLARAVDYVGAGTVEFLVEDDRFYFLEMNTRIQVEHPVTEEVLGLDLVAEQIKVAAGQPLSLSESGPEPRGHAIECRINAEDVSGGRFVPSPGRIETLDIPLRPGVRFEAGYAAGDEVQPYYDSMIGKLVVWAPDRDTAVRRTLAVLDDLRIGGVPTTVPAARAVLGHPDFSAVRFTTGWLETAVTFPPAPPADTPADPVDPETDGQDRRQVWVGERRYDIPFFGAPDLGTPDREHPVTSTFVAVEHAGERQRPSRAARSRKSGPPRGAEPGGITSPMQGTVVAAKIAVGDQVVAGQELFVVEAMKMENPVRATAAGTVRTVLAAVGDVVTAGAVLALVSGGPVISDGPPSPDALNDPARHPSGVSP